MNNTINNNNVAGVPGALAANETGGGISNGPGATFSLVNSIVAGNTAPTNPDVDGNFNDLGHNFIGDGTGGDFINGANGDQVGDSVNPLDPMLGPLQDNGGGLETELPLAGSPVIDAGDNSYAAATDARGYIRIINNIIDLGAVEYNSYPAATTIYLSSSVNPSTPNQAVTFTANVSGNSVMPSGTVTFMADNTILGTSTLDSNGNATFTTSTLSLGSHTITAVYNGDDNYPSNAAFLTQTVSLAPSITSLSSNANPAQPGQMVTYTATIAGANPGSATPTGTVTFYNGTTVLGTFALDANGQVVYSTSFGTGEYDITVIYGGDNVFLGSRDDVDQIVGQPSTVSSGVELDSSASPSLPGQPVTITATVYGSQNLGTPTGSVTFYDGTTVLGTAMLDANGIATFTTSTLTLGDHSITGIYSGDGTYGGIEGGLIQSVALAGSTTSLTSSVNPSPQGQEVTFTATIQWSGPVTPTGTVNFYDGTTLIGTGTVTVVNGQAQATFTTAALGLGAHTIVAIYSGDSTYADSGASLQEEIS